MDWKKLAFILVVAGAYVGLFLYFGMRSEWGQIDQSDPAEISKQSATVQNYLELHPNAEYRISKNYLMGDGMVYAVEEDWKITELLGSTDNPKDEKGHYCWVVRWYNPSGGIPYVVYVYIDRDTLKILVVIEAI